MRIQTGLPFCHVLLALAVSVSAARAQDFLNEPRVLAPGVLQVIAPELDARDSFSLPMTLPNLSAESYQGNFTPNSQTLRGQATSVILFRDIWQLEFATTGLRQVRMTYRASDGTLIDRHYWYLVYRIRDFGKSLSYEDVTQQASFEYVRKEIRQDAAKSDRTMGPGKFLPRFSLEGWAENRDGNFELKTWRDAWLPEVTREIQKLEDPNVRLYDQQEISSIEIPLAENETSPGLWGVAIWEDVDPTLDYVSVFVRGLTNAWRIDPSSLGPDGQSAADLKDVRLHHKTLQLNFWRPGDEVAQQRDDISYGIPLVDDPAEQVLICRRYRLPGPVLNVYYRNPKANQDVLLTSVDGQVSLGDFTSPLVTGLNGKTLPADLATAVSQMGLPVAADAAVAVEVENRWWSIQVAGPEGPLDLNIRLEPLFWEKKDDGIRFIGTLENFWIYR